MEPTRQALDAVTGEPPAALIAKDYHSLWLNTAALALANGDLEVAGGVVERDAQGEPTGVLREESAWRFKERHMLTSDEEYLDAMRAGIKLAHTRGVTAVHDKDGWLGALRLWQRLEAEGSLTLRVLQSVPHEQVGELRALGIRSSFGSPMLKLGHLKVFMDGTLGSQTAWMLDGSGVQITSGEELAEIVRHGAEAGFPVAVHAIGDRANREALDAFEATRDVWQPLGPAPPDRARPVPRARGSAALRGARHRVLGAVLPCALRPRPGRPLLGREDRRRLRLPRALGFGRARRERLRRADRGARPARRDPRRRPQDDRRAPRVAPRAGGDGRAGAAGDDGHAAWLAGDEHRRGKLMPGFLADLVVLDRDPVDDLDAAGRGDDGRRPLGAQPAALGLKFTVSARSRHPSRASRLASLDGTWGGRWVSRSLARQPVGMAPTSDIATMRAMRTMNPVHVKPSCSVAACAEIIGSKWTALLVHDLSEGPRRFSELEHSCPGISPRTLSERLRALEHEEIVERHSYPESPPRVEYELTEKGHALLPIIEAMREFGHEWLADDHAHAH